MPALRPNVRGGGKHKREGRGFSLQELSTAGLNVQDAKRLCLMVDRRRTSSLDDNVKVLLYMKKEAMGG